MKISTISSFFNENFDHFSQFHTNVVRAFSVNENERETFKFDTPFFIGGTV